MVVLYPIKPIYIERILSGEKRYELRRKLPKDSPNYILLYSTWPVKQIVGYASVADLHKSEVKVMWEQVSDYAGIEKADYFKYFNNTESACAIEFSKVYRFKKPFGLSEIAAGFKAPQSFCYLDKNIFNRIKKREAVLV